MMFGDVKDFNESFPGSPTLEMIVVLQGKLCVTEGIGRHKTLLLPDGSGKYHVDELRPAVVKP